MDRNDIAGSQYAQGDAVDPESDEDERGYIQEENFETDSDDTMPICHSCQPHFKVYHKIWLFTP